MCQNIHKKVKQLLNFQEQISIDTDSDLIECHVIPIQLIRHSFTAITSPLPLVHSQAFWCCHSLLVVAVLR